MDRETLGKGRTATVYKLDDKRVIKLFNKNISLDSIKKEAAIYKALNNIELAPRFHSIERYNNKTGIVMEMVHGKSMLSLIEEHPLRVKDYAKVMAQIHYKLHSFNKELPKSFNNVFSNASSIDILGSDSAFIQNYTIELNKTYTKFSICHGDFHPDNIMLNENEKVLDWTNAYKGNPLSDVAKTSLILSSPFIPDEITGLARFFIKIIKRKLKKSYINEYLKLSKYSKTDLNLWTLPMAVVRLGDNIPAEKEWLMDIIKDEINKADIY